MASQPAWTALILTGCLAEAELKFLRGGDFTHHAICSEALRTWEFLKMCSFDPEDPYNPYVNPCHDGIFKNTFIDIASVSSSSRC